MNPPPPINALATALATFQKQLNEYKVEQINISKLHFYKHLIRSHFNVFIKTGQETIYLIQFIN